jgi:hypothetical protein
MTLIDAQFVAQNPDLFKFIESTTGEDFSGSKLDTTDYIVAKLKIGSREFTDVRVAAYDFGSYRKYFGTDTPIILGNNIITHLNWILDLQSSVWSIDP